MRPLVTSVATAVLVATSLLERADAGQPCPPSSPAVIECYLEAGKYADAERIARTQWESVSSEAGRDSLAAARASDYLIITLIKRGRSGLASTLQLAENAVRIKSAALSPSNPELAISLENLAGVRADRGEFSAAAVLYERAVAVRERASSPADLALALTLENLAYTRILQERLREATEALTRARRLRERSEREAGFAAARSLAIAALLHKYDGDYPEGLRLIEGALASQTQLDPAHPDIAFSEQIHGDLLYLSGDAAAAATAWAHGLDIGRRALGEEHPLVILLIRESAVSAQNFGDLERAGTLLEYVLPIAERVLAPCHQEIPAVLDELANVLGYQGEYVRARALYARALAVRQRCLGPTHSLTATVVHNQALLAASMGDLAEAQRLHQRALDMWTAGLGRNHPYVARALDALAQVVAARGDNAAARSLYMRALRIRRQIADNEGPDVAWTLTNIAQLSAASGNLTNASIQTAEALAIYRRGARPQEPDHLARTLQLQGAIAVRRGDFDHARAAFDEARNARVALFGGNHPLVAASLQDVATAQFGLGHTDAALDGALRAERMGLDHLRFTIRYLPERQALAYASIRPRGLDLALSIASVNTSIDPASILDAAIRSRGVVLDELAARAQSTSATEDVELGTVTAAMLAARQRYATLLFRSLDSEDGASPRLLDEARRDKEDAERAVAERSAAARSEAERAQVGLDDVRRALPPGSVVVSFLRYERTTLVRRGAVSALQATPSYIALIARVDAPDIRVIPLGGAASLERLVDTWRTEAGGRAIGAGAQPREAERTYRAAAVALRMRVWDPLAAALAGTTRVFVVPDGAVNLVNFSALPVGNRYLLETGPAIHYLSTERDLVRSDVASGRGLLALGGPAFDSQPTPASTAVRRSGCATIGNLRFEDLPGSRSEIQDVARVWGNTGDVVVLSGREATKMALTREIGGRKVVHLATHGFFLGGECGTAAMPQTRGVGGLAAATTTRVDNPLLLAGLALAGANTLTGTRQASAILNAEEIAGLNLQGTEWAVLSACDTGLGQISAGEGVFGLRRALQIAGVRTVIMSLWSVEDQSTRDWMKALYEARLKQQLDTPESVRTASLRLLEDRRKRGASTHPFYWAAFVAAGDWR